jgi:uncharacterized membrane protein
VPLRDASPSFRFLLPASLFVFAVLLYANSAGNGFVLDDTFAIEHNPLLRSLKNIPTLFTSDYWAPKMKGGLYRPLVTTSYALNYALGGSEPAGYHLVNIALHALNSLLVLLLYRRLTENALVSAVAAFFFAAHAIHTEAVASAVGRAELMCAAFFLGSMLCYIPRERGDAPNSGGRTAASLALYALALLCKENAVTLPAVIVLYDLVYRGRSKPGPVRSLAQLVRSRWRNVYGGYVAVTLVYLAVRYLVMSSGGPVDPTDHVDNPLIGLALQWRIPNVLQVGYRYLWLLCFPLHLSYDYSHAQIPLITTLSDARLLATLAFAAASLWIASWSYRRSRDLFFALGFGVVTMSIVSNAFVLIGTIMAERLLYLPSVGFCLAAMIALERASGMSGGRRTARAVFVVVCAIIVSLNGWRTVLRNADWKSHSSLYMHDLEVSPRSAKVRHNAAVMLFFGQGRAEEALAQLEEGGEIYDPERRRPDPLLGHLLMDLGRKEEAIAVYERIVARSRLSDINVYNNLGLVLVEDEIDVERGLGLLESAVEVEPENPHFLDSLGWAYFKAGRLREAYERIERSLEIDDSGPSGAARRSHLEEVEKALRGDTGPQVRSEEGRATNRTEGSGAASGSGSGM